MRRWVVGLAIVGAAGTNQATKADQLPKLALTTNIDKHTDFAALRTYAWTAGWPAMEAVLDRRIVSAVDQQLTALGLMRLESARCDVLVSYEWVRRTDIEPKSVRKTPFSQRLAYPVGTLQVALLDPQSKRELFRARADAPLETEPAQVSAQIDGIVAELFAKYPARNESLR